MVPTVSSVIQMAEMPAQDLMHARLNDMEKQITGISGEPSLHCLKADGDRIPVCDLRDHCIRWLKG